MKHRERLDQYSMLIRVVSPNLGGTQETMCYSAKGVYEICRWSRQPKADEFYDKVYDLLEQVRKQGFYGTVTKEGVMRLAQKAGVTVDEYAEFRTGKSVKARIAAVRQEAAEVVDWSTYRFSVQDIMADTGATHGDILNMTRKKKLTEKKSLPNMYRVS